MKKKAAAEAAAAAEDGGDAAAEHAAPVHHADPSHPPTFVPLDPFVVNLADHDSEKYAQIGITLQVDDAHFADQMKTYMPAVRNAILMVLAQKSAKDLMGRTGKEDLADEIMREAVRPMGIDIAAPEPVTAAPVAVLPVVAPVPASAAASGLVAAAAEASGADKAKVEEPARAKKPRRPASATHNPVQHVHFSSFIIQ